MYAETSLSSTPSKSEAQRRPCGDSCTSHSLAYPRVGSPGRAREKDRGEDREHAARVHQQHRATVRCTRAAVDPQPLATRERASLDPRRHVRRGSVPHSAPKLCEKIWPASSNSDQCVESQSPKVRFHSRTVEALRLGSRLPTVSNGNIEARQRTRSVNERFLVSNDRSSYSYVKLLVRSPWVTTYRTITPCWATSFTALSDRPNSTSYPPSSNLTRSTSWRAI